MKNRIVKLFGSYMISDKANILYNNYIKQTKNKLKNFYNFYFKKWFSENKRIIFALLVVTMVYVINCSMKPLTSSVNKSKITDTLQMKISVKSHLISDTVTNDESEINTFDEIRDVVFRESGLWVPKNLPEEHLRTMYIEALDKEIPLTIFFRWIYAESVFKHSAKSRCGAIGYTQLMPSTYSRYRKKLKLARGANNNIKIGAYYLREMYDYWAQRKANERKRWALALASYNGNIVHIKNAVPARSAKYVDFILKNGYE